MDAGMGDAGPEGDGIMASPPAQLQYDFCDGPGSSQSGGSQSQGEQRLTTDLVQPHFVLRSLTNQQDIGPGDNILSKNHDLLHCNRCLPQPRITCSLPYSRFACMSKALMQAA